MARILKDWAANTRFLVDVRADLPQEAMIRPLSYVDIVLWCIRQEDTYAAIQLLRGFEKSVPKWRDKIRIVWLLGDGTPIPPDVPELYEVAERDFKLAVDPRGLSQHHLLQHGFERIVHHLRGI